MTASFKKGKPFYFSSLAIDVKLMLYAYNNFFHINNLELNNGAAEKTRTSTDFTPQRPQRCASTSSATAANYLLLYQYLIMICKLINKLISLTV